MQYVQFLNIHFPGPAIGKNGYVNQVQDEIQVIVYRRTLLLAKLPNTW